MKDNSLDSLMKIESFVWKEIDKICAVNGAWVEMRNQESCVSTFVEENMFETEAAEDNVYVNAVVENLKEQGISGADAESVNQAFISYFYRDELIWSADNEWSLAMNYMTDVGWSEAESLERIIDYLEREEIATNSLKVFLAGDEHQLDTDDEEIREQMERLGL